MSSIASLSSAPAAPLPISGHGHGHKRGAAVDSTDSSATDAGQAPSGSVQNLFGNLLDTMEQVIGLQSNTAPAAAASTVTPSAVTPSAATTARAVSSSGAGTSAGHRTANTLLQNYLNNLSHNQPGSTVSANA